MNMFEPITNETALEAAEAITKDSIRSVAKSLGVSRATVRRRAQVAAKRGLIKRQDWAPAVPQGFELHKVSTYVNKDGKVSGQWFCASPEGQALTSVLEIIDETLSHHEGKSIQHDAPNISGRARDLLTAYALGDHHLGLYVWAMETGEDYDTEIAWRLLEETMTDLVECSPAAGTAIVLNLGDFFHIDNNNARTENSGNHLDMDTRFARVISMGVDLTVLTIELALQKHARVIYRALPGNHDPHAALALTIAVSKYFRNNSRVLVDLDPSKFFCYQHGLVMLASTHGDMVKAPDFPSFMAAKWPKIWGATEFRYGYLGHTHHKAAGSGERFGATWESFQTLAPKDSWHSGMGYMSQRSMTAITHHRDCGERFRVVRNINWTKGA